MRGPEPFRVTVRAPGRVNLLGGHVDFHGGLVVCAAIDRHVVVRASAHDRDEVVLRSEGFDGVVGVGRAALDEPWSVRPAWGRLAAGVLAQLRDAHGVWAPFDATISSDLPAGGGLSSSAALEVALARAALAVAGAEVPDMEVAQLGCAAELTATGVPCGIQDQAASVLGGVQLLDCRDLSAVPLALPDGVALVVVDSGVTRRLEGSPWAARRAESFEDAREIGVEQLRDATLDQTVGRPRARHVVSEIERVRRFADVLRRGDVAEAGRLMVESHASSRDLWQSSVPALDVIVEELVAAGAHGARLTGGGFGGCVVALVPSEGAEGIGRRAANAAAARLGHAVNPMVLEVAGPAAVVAG